MSYTYSFKYFRRHYEQDKLWEVEIGKNIVQILGIKSMLDLGCGVGAYMEGVYDAGCTDIMGFELHTEHSMRHTSEHIRKYISKCDITAPIDIGGKKFDCCLSIEVGEHILPEGSEEFVNNLTKHSDKYIILTAAPPGQRGSGHINLREKEFWKKLIEEKGFFYQEDLTNAFKKIWGDILIPDVKFSTVPSFIMSNLMIFKKV